MRYPTNQQGQDVLDKLKELGFGYLTTHDGGKIYLKKVGVNQYRISSSSMKHKPVTVKYAGIQELISKFFPAEEETLS